MTNSSSSSSGLHRLLDSIGKCSGSTFRAWKESFEYAINIHAPELLTILRGSARPDSLAATLAEVTAWDKADSRLYSLLFFPTTGSARITVQAHRKAGTSAEGNGQLSSAALNARFDAHTQEARRACHKELFALTHVTGGDPVDFFSKGCELKLRLENSGGESIRQSLPGYHALGPDVCPGIPLYPADALPKRIYIGRLSSGHCQPLLCRPAVAQGGGARGLELRSRDGRVQQRPVPPLQGVWTLPPRLSEVCAVVPTDEREEARQEARKWGEWAVQVVLLSPHEDAQRC